MKERIVVVEDEPSIAASVAARLEAAGYEVSIAGDGPSAVELIRATDPDLVVLDVMLPGFDGLEVCQRIQRQRRVPVLMLTALDDEIDLLVGLKVGADDYLTKPFSPRELVARVEVILRRSRHFTPNNTLLVGSLRIDEAARLATLNDEPVHLTATEFDLLVHLARAQGSVVSREGLLSAVWGWASDGSSRTVDSHVRSIRRKVGSSVIRTVHGVGYAIGSGETAGATR